MEVPRVNHFIPLPYPPSHAGNLGVGDFCLHLVLGANNECGSASMQGSKRNPTLVGAKSGRAVPGPAEPFQRPLPDGPRPSSCVAGRLLSSVWGQKRNGGGEGPFPFAAMGFGRCIAPPLWGDTLAPQAASWGDGRATNPSPE